MKYSKRVELAFSDDKKAHKTEIELAISDAKLSIRQSFIDYEKQINRLTQSIDNAKSSVHLDPEHIINLQMKLRVCNEKLEMLKSLDKELF